MRRERPLDLARLCARVACNCLARIINLSIVHVSAVLYLGLFLSFSFSQVSELIHKSAEYPDLDYARVSVYFQEIIDDAGHEDAYAVVPGSQFIVTRTAHRNNSSKYYINGSGSTFSEASAGPGLAWPGLALG